MVDIKYVAADSSGHVTGDMDGQSDYQISFDFGEKTQDPFGFKFDESYISPVTDQTFTVNIGDSPWQDPKYAFNEGELLKEIKTYIDGTYDAHYSQGKYQATQIIEDCGHGMGFALGNVLKYSQRYGKKEGLNRADLLKVVHYGIIALAMHDRATDQPKDYLKLQ